MSYHVKCGKRPLRLVVSLSLAISCAAALPLWAEGADSVESTTAEAAQQAKRPLGINDMLAWEGIKEIQLSGDGRWFAYIVGPAEGNAEMVIKRIGADREHRFPAGNAERAGRFAFSENAQWLAFNISPDFKVGKGGRPPVPPSAKVGLVNLTDGELTEFEGVQQFQFGGESNPWLALHKSSTNAAPSRRPQPGPGAGAAGKKTKTQPPTGRDLILRRLDSGDEFNIGNVSEFAFDDDGEYLAWVVDSKGQSGNGVQIRDLSSDVVRVLDSGKARYKRLTWMRDNNALTFLKGSSDKGYEDLLYSVVGVKKPAAKKAVKTVYNPHEDDSFPEGFTISANQAPYWNDSMDTLVFGIAQVKAVEKPAKPAPGKPDSAKTDAEEPSANKEPSADKEPSANKEPSADKKPSADKEPSANKKPDNDKKGSAPAPGGKGKPADNLSPDEKPGLVIWHWSDKRLQSQQQKEAGRDKNRSYLASYRVKSKAFVRHGDDTTPSVQATPHHTWGLGFDRSRYQLMGSLNGKRFSDVYRINLKTGERKLALEKIRWGSELSPNGRYYLYYLNGHYHTLELATGKTRNITKGVKTSFINTENDHPQVDPPRPALGWAKGEKWVLLSDGWDIWKVSATGGKSENLTRDGKRKQIRYSNVQTYNEDARFEGIDLSDDIYLQAYGEWSKKSGFGRLNRQGKGVQMLKWGDAKYGLPHKAKDADVFAYSRQTPVVYPDFYSTNGSFKEATRLTEINTQQQDFDWTAGARLIDFTTDKGVKLQASLTLPANYQPGKKYPTIVYIYEKRSQDMNNYAMPGVRGFNLSHYTSNGYAVLQPDIVYEIDNPGMSAVWAVLPALKAAIATGIVDEGKVGLHGHSWGGYQSSFLATQTDAFAAIVTGAPLTNMISMYGTNYWNSGVSNGSIFEDTQGRFSSHYLDIPEAYTRNSPVYFADKVSTPMVLLHNDQDGAVDWNQGVEYYNILRRLGKEVVMLQYVGENHGVRKAANRKDYTVRMMEFFDHQLKGAKAPDWWQNGIPHLKMEEHVKERVARLKQQARERQAKKVADQKAASDSKTPASEGSGAE